MRFIGLTLALLASSFGARAESLEDGVVALEARVKTLEAALHAQAVAPTASNSTSIDGAYKATMPNGDVVTVEFARGRVVASTGKESKTGTYEIIGQRVVVSADGKSESLTIDGDHLRGDTGNGHPIDFVRTK
jgi:hypothetical protein